MVLMVVILDGNSKHAAQKWMKIGLFGEKISDFWSIQMPYTYQITEIAPYVCTYLWVTI